MTTYLASHARPLIALAAMTLSIGAWIVFYRLGLTTDYNDAMSHLNIARLVIDNLQPGMSQLGSVWLPMSHLLSLPLIWNDQLWHTGLAGSLISMVSFVMGAVGIYSIVVHLSASKLAGAIGAGAFCLCLNLLYLQATPLTEPLYMTLFIYTLLFLLVYLRDQSSKALIALGIISAVGILTRYDAWFVAAVIGVIIVMNELVVQKKAVSVMVGYLTLYAFPIAFAVGLWLGWNLLIFGDPLYAFVGPYSAKAQQAIIASSSGLITKYNLSISAWAYLLSILRNVGLIITLLGSIGWIIYLATYKQVKRSVKLFVFAAALSVVAFNVIALFLGFSILNLPELHWNPSGRQAGELFNVRYGVLALPLLAIGTGLLLTRLQLFKKTAPIMLTLLIIGQFILTDRTGIITIQDGQSGSSAFVNQDIAGAIHHDVKPGQRVIMSTSSYNAVAFESGLDLRSFVHEGVSSSWNGAISQPEKYGQWIVIAKNDVGEPVYTSLVKKQHSAFLEKYALAYSGTYANLYRLKQ
ncbi:MAG: hypothetical protein ACHQTE_00895 [Candidatus Saccharimonadales bacterium]